MKLLNLQSFFLLFLLLSATYYSGTISGNITEKETSDPVVGATIELFGMDGTLPSGDSLFFNTTTNENGEFILENIPAGEYTLTVIAEGFIRLTPEVFKLAENEVIPDFDFELEVLLFYNLKGFVIDSQNEANIPNALIVISNEFNVRETLSGQDGSYELLQVPGGTYSINVSADGYKDLGGPNFSVVFEGDEQDQELDIFLQPVIETSVTISGKVSFDDSGDPVVGAEIEFINENGAFFSTAVSDSEGNYSISLVPGSYIVRCTYVGPFSSFFYEYSEFYDDARNPANAESVEVSENEEIPDIDFGIPDPVGPSTITISGKVTDTESNPVENALITIEKNPYIISEFVGFDSTNYFVETNIDGEYEITFVSYVNPSNSFIVRADADDHYPQYYDGKFSNISADILTALGDTTFSDIDFELTEYDNTSDGSISGRVTDNDGNPIAGAKVTFNNPLLLTFVVIIAETDSAGFYEMDGLLYGDYYVTFSAEGFVPEIYNDQKEWDKAEFVLVQGKVEDINAKLDRVENGANGNFIAGKVKSAEDGSIIQGALVTLQNSNGESVKFAYSDNQGNYEIRSVLPADYSMVISHIDFQSETRTVSIANNEQVLVAADAVLFGRSITNVDDNNGIEEIQPEIKLENNYPNPFNPSTTIGFSINQAQQVKLIIYNMLGQQVKELINKFTQPGNYRISWDATDSNGNEVSTGIYLYSLETQNFKQVKKMILTK